MGSCENSLEVHEPLQQAYIEQHLCSIKNSDSEKLPCSEAGVDVIDNDVGPTGALDGFLELSQNDSAGCVSSSELRGAESVDWVIGSATEVECGNERQSGIDDCSVETDGFCVEKEASNNENNGSENSLEDCERSLELVHASSSVRNCDQQDEEKDDWNVRREMEEKTDGLAGTKIETCDQMMPSFNCEMPAELIAVDALAINGVEPDKDIRAILERAVVVMENKTAGLVEIDTDNHSQTGPASNYVQLDDQKDQQLNNSPSAKVVTEVIKTNSNVSPMIETIAHNQLFSCQGFDEALELMPKTDSSEESIKQEEQNDDGSITLPSEQGVMEKKSNLSTGVKCNLNNQTFSSMDDEMHVELDPFPLLPKHSCQQNDLEAKTVNSVGSMGVVNGKSDASATTDSDICIQKTLHHIAMPKESSITGSLESTCERKNDQKNGFSVNCFTAETVSTDILKKSGVDKCIQAYPSQACQRTLENLAIADSLGNPVYEPFIEGMPGIVEEESDVTTEIKFEIHGQKFCVEGDAYDLKEGSPEKTPSSAQSCQPFGKDVSHDIYSSHSVDCSEQIDKEGKVLAGSCPSKTTCLDIGSSSSRRSKRIRKSGQKTQTKRAAKKRKNKAKLQDLQIFKADRRKRSCFSKPARSSNWGLLGNITQFFEQSNGLGLNEIQYCGPRKIKVEQGNGKRGNSQPSGSSQKSSGKKNSSTGGIRLKVIVRKEVGQNSLNLVVPEVIDTSTSGVLVSEFEAKTYTGTSSKIPNVVSGAEDKMGEREREEQLQCFGNKLEEAKVYPNASVSDFHVADKDFEGHLICQNSAVDAAADYLGVPSHLEVDISGEATEKRYTDPGTSPDSEVINLVPEGQVNATCQEDLHDVVLTSPKAFVAAGAVARGKKGKKKDRRIRVSDNFAEDISPGMSSMKSVKTTKKHGGRQGKDDGFLSSQILISPTKANVSSNFSSHKEFSEEQLHLSRKTEFRVSEEALQAESGLDFGPRLSESQNSNNLLHSVKSKSKGGQLPKKSDGASKRRSKTSDKARSKKENGCGQRGSERKTVNKNKAKEKSECDHVYKSADNPETGNCIAKDTGKTNPVDSVASIDVANLDMASTDAVEQQPPADNAWVRCDDCHKWRRIPVTLVDLIGQSNCQWICEDNMDKAFADCSIPQEKSNAEINAELGLSDADEDAYDAPLKNKGLEWKRTAVSKEHEFTRISTNQFLHRCRKTQTIDEIMVCHCKLPLHGGLGCGDECLNRMLNIECVQGTCPCGDLCSNQQFQKRHYAKMQWARCGKKGFGLRLEEDISKGQFLIEYVGEVLDMHTYEVRMREYASMSHKHFYFMTLNGSEVIDACAKGNLGRFINHSCDPNCRTEKWVVNGEICIGLFALRDIKKGEEVTFDYNYVRVVGAAAKQCYCGSPQCRGYIGGDPTSTEVIDQVDSDEEFPEPVMLEDGEAGERFKNRLSRISSFDGVELQVAESISKDRNKMDISTTATEKMEVGLEIEDGMNQSVSAISQLSSPMEMNDSRGDIPSSSQPVEMSAQADDVISKSASPVKQEISKEDIQSGETCPTAMLSKLSSDGMVANRKSKSATAEEKRVFVKSRFLIKTSHHSGSGKKGKFTSNPTNANKVQMVASKSQLLSIKPKRSIDGTSNGRFEAVEEKLNELLDADGGISKRKDAPKVYLKLLLLTAASGASGNGEAIQSNRDLSMILDALLKTKSRVVLIDIINKNGLRMLHNMIKQYRWDFKKIPILRKLLKVLEYLAVREILTPEHINGGPPCPGMERLMLNSAALGSQCCY
ncbi:histone-lysine N-methyltransferase ASHH2 isoform X2 [Jatropha curcas]|uniref:histone-lysine N-methyltransferase ASHH2 isoform X2 n=1 Tax=Jatropha curcas TaxID=180498 RepID=UPI0018940F8F|nr:histone-lysine N-methyltransferase ASHH2 isoform X2 [Jatropha curcas]